MTNPDSASTDALVHLEVFPVSPAGPWVANSAVSKWIGPRADTANSATGDYVYRTTIDLTGLDPSTVVISGRSAIDNVGVNIKVNDTDTGQVNNNGFGDYTSFTLASSNATFVAGVNTIDFVVNNQEPPGWTGLRVEMTGTAQLPGTPPEILRHPRSLCVSEGGTALFDVLASGSPAPTYQWQKDGVDLPGETGTSFLISPVFAGDDGAYRVIVKNTAGSVTSLVAQLTVGLPMTNPSFEADTFSAFPGYVSGNGPITGWNAKGGHGINPGVGFSPFADNGTIPDGAQVAFLQEDGGMTNTVGGFTVGKQYFVQYDENSRLGDSPTDPALALTVGGTTVVAAHTVPPVGGSNPYRRVISEVFVASATDLEVIFIKSNPQGGDNSALIDNVCIAEVAPNTPPSILREPESQIVQVGDSATFSVQVFGSLPFSFQWRKNGMDITGATGPTLTLNAVAKSDEGDYSVKITNAGGMATSANAHLTVFEAIPDLFNTGVNNSRAALPDGAVDPHYKLTENPDTGSPDAIVEDSLTFPIVAGPWVPNTSTSKWIGPQSNTTASAVGVYVYRTTIDLTGRDPSTVVIVGQWATDNPGNDILVNGVTTGNPASPGFTAYTPFAIASSNATFVAGSNAIDFVVENVQAVGYTGLRVNILQSNVRIPPGVPPMITGQPQEIKAVIGDSATFTATASGTSPLHYQWKKDGVELPGQTSPTLTLANVRPADSGNYTVCVTNIAGLAMSDKAALCVCLQPIPGIFGTGVDNNGGLLANSAVDPHYTLTASIDPNHPGPDAFVVIDGQFPIPPWVASGPKSKWIAPLADQSVGVAEGDYTFTTSFDLTGYDPAHVSLMGQWAVDNLGTDILVNGTSTGITSPGFATFTPFTLSSGLTAGVNTLDFKMNNLPATPNPAGLRVDLRGLVEIGPFLRIQRRTDGRLDLSWACPDANQVLQCAPAVLGPWTSCPNQSNPQTITPCNNGCAQFYRVVTP